MRLETMAAIVAVAWGIGSGACWWKSARLTATNPTASIYLNGWAATLALVAALSAGVAFLVR